MLKKTITLTFLLTAGLQGLSQQADQYLNSFFAVQQDNNVFIRWTISAGNTCDGTRIERSDNGESFEKIGEIPGVCGSPDQSVTYDYTDTAASYNKVLYYRLEMGILGYSSPFSVEVIRLNEEGYSVNPNPVVNISTLIFDNPDNESHEIQILNIKGETVLNEVTTSDRVKIERNLLSAGAYIFKILKGNQLKARGKLIVL